MHELPAVLRTARPHRHLLAVLRLISTRRHPSALLTDQLQIALLLLGLHTTRRHPSPLAHPSLQIIAVLQRSLESAPSRWGQAKPSLSLN